MNIGRLGTKGSFEGLEQRFLEEMESIAIASVRLTIGMARIASRSVPRKMPPSNLDHYGRPRRHAGVVLANDDGAEIETDAP